MKANIDSWHRFATWDVGIDVKDEDIYFVRGWVKTTRWAVVAFFGNSRHAKLKFKGDLNLPVSAAFEIDMQSESAAQCVPRIGPDYRPRLDMSQPGGALSGHEDYQSGPSSTAHSARNKRKRNKSRADEERHSRHSGDMRMHDDARVQEQVFESDQCMFLHYFKMKRRILLPRRIEAAAEPQDPSVDRDADSDMRVEAVPPQVAVSSHTAPSVPLTELMI